MPDFDLDRSAERRGAARPGPTRALRHPCGGHDPRGRVRATARAGHAAQRRGHRRPGGGLPRPGRGPRRGLHERGLLRPAPGRRPRLCRDRCSRATRTRTAPASWPARWRRSRPSRAASGLWIARTAWLYGPPGDDFPDKITAAADRLPEGEPLPVVADEFGSPTSRGRSGQGHPGARGGDRRWHLPPRQLGRDQPARLGERRARRPSPGPPDPAHLGGPVRPGVRPAARGASWTARARPPPVSRCDRGRMPWPSTSGSGSMPAGFGLKVVSYVPFRG